MSASFWASASSSCASLVAMVEWASSSVSLVMAEFAMPMLLSVACSSMCSLQWSLK